MNSKKIPQKIYFFFSLLVIAVSAALNTYFSVYYYEEDSFYFKLNFDAYKYLYYAMGIFAIVTLIFSLIFSRRNQRKAYKKHSDISNIFSMLVGFLLAGGAIVNGLKLLDSTYDFSILFLCSVVLSLVASVFFIFYGVSKYKLDKPCSILSLLVIVWLIVYLLDKYFTMNSPMNSPFRVMSQLTILAAMLFMVQEARIFFNIQIPILHYSFGIILPLIGVTYSLSDLTLTFVGIREVSSDTIYNAAFFMLSIFALVRVGESIFSKIESEDIPTIKTEKKDDTIEKKENNISKDVSDVKEKEVDENSLDEQINSLFDDLGIEKKEVTQNNDEISTEILFEEDIVVDDETIIQEENKETDSIKNDNNDEGLSVDDFIDEFKKSEEELADKLLEKSLDEIFPSENQ